MSKTITHLRKNIRIQLNGSLLFVVGILVLGSTIGLVTTSSDAMAEQLKKFQIKDKDSDRSTLFLQPNSYLAFQGNDADTKDTNIDVGETIIINGDHCGVEDEDSGTSYPVDCNTGDPL